MEYLTSEEIAQRWDISSRRVTTLCKNGRIDGAIRKGGIWLIPDDAQKPESMKRGRKADRVVAVKSDLHISRDVNENEYDKDFEMIENKWKH